MAEAQGFYLTLVADNDVVAGNTSTYFLYSLEMITIPSNYPPKRVYSHRFMSYSADEVSLV